MKKVSNQLFIVTKKSQLMRLFLKENILEIKGNGKTIPKFKHFSKMVNDALEILEIGYPISVECSPKDKLYRTTFYMSSDLSPEKNSNFVRSKLDIYSVKENKIFYHSEDMIGTETIATLNVNELNTFILNGGFSIDYFSLSKLDSDKLIDLFEVCLLELVEGHNARWIKLKKR